MRSLTIKAKLLSVIALVMISLAISCAVSLVVIERVKVGGVIFGQIIQDKDLIADVLPPPCFLLESYLTCLEMVNASVNIRKDPKGLEVKTARWNTLADEYQKRTAFWKTNGVDADIAKIH